MNPDAFTVETADVRGFRQAFVREGAGGVPLLCVHGWPETKRIWWKVIRPLADAGFEVIVPDLRGYGDSGLPPDGYSDGPSHARDLLALLEELGHDRVVLCGGDLGGVVVQELAMREPDLVDRMVVFNSPLPRDPEAMEGLRTMPPRESMDYFLRQGTDADRLAAELDTPERRRAYVSTFYTSRYWAHPGGFTDEEVAFQVEPFADGERLRASWGAYESFFSEERRSEPPAMGIPNPTRTLVLFGPSDHVIHPDFDRMAEVVFPNRVGPFLLRDCGHFVQWEAAGRLASATEAFCADLL